MRELILMFILLSFFSCQKRDETTVPELTPISNLPPVSYEMVYGAGTFDEESLQAKIAGNEPPKMTVVVSAWKRFSGAVFYPDGGSVVANPAYCQTTLDANGSWSNGTRPNGTSVNPNTASECNTESMNSLSWTYLENPDRLYNIMNTNYYVGFFSPLKFHSYTAFTTVSSDDTDDDAIGFTIALYRDPNNGDIHTLSAYRTQGGLPPDLGWGLVYKVNGTTASIKLFGNKSVGGVNKNSSSGDRLGWNGRKSKIQVVRENNIVKAYCSPWGTGSTTLTVDPNSLIELDLSDPANGLTMFVGSHYYGYESKSQSKATFSDLSFETPQAVTNKDYIYDLKNNEVYQKKASGVGYELVPGIKATDRLYYPRRYSNIETLKTYQINSENDIVDVSQN